MDVLGSLKKVIKYVFRANGFTITFQGSDTTPPTKNIEVNIVDGAAVQEMVTDSSTNTLTNKTIDADGTGNVILNIDSDNIKDGGVATDDIADDAITNDKIATDAVTSDSILAGAVGTDEIADDAVTAAKINADLAGNGLTQAVGGELDVNVDDSTIEIDTDTVRVKADGITSNEIAADAITATELADDAVDTDAIVDNAVTADKLADDAVDTGSIADGSVTTDKLADDAVTADKINADVAGNGLVQGAGGELDVNVDDSSIEVVADVVQVKDLGITNAKLADDAVDNSKLADDAVQTENILDANVTTDKIADDAINNDKIATDAVNSDSILAGAVGTDELDDLAVTDAKVNDVAAGKITGSFPELYLDAGSSVEAGNAIAIPADFTYIDVTSAATGTVNNITGLTTDRYILLKNNTGAALFITETGNVVTGTGATLEVADESTLILYYDGAKANIVGGSGAGGGGGGITTELYTHSTLPTTLEKDIRYLVDVSGGNAAATMPVIDATNDGSAIEVWPINAGVTGNTITLTAGAAMNFNDPDLGQDTEYVQDVGRSRYVLNDTNSTYEIGDSYWAAASDANETLWQRKNLTSNITVDTGEVADLSFYNLTIGKTYKYYVQARVAQDASDVSVNLTVDHDGATIAASYPNHAGAAETDNILVIFTATADKITFGVSSVSSGTVIQATALNRTYAILEELPQHTETTKFT